MITQEAELLQLAVTAHEAAADPAIWPEFLKRYAQAVQADITLVQRHYLHQHRSELLTTFGMTRRFSDSYNQHYSQINVWREHGRHLYVEGRVLFDEDFYPRPLLKRTEFYNEYLVPARVTQCLTGVIACRGDEALVLTAMRDEPKEPFDKAQARTIGFLLPHIARARATEERLQVLEAGEAALNALNLGVVLVAPDRHVVFCNRAAEEIFRACDGLSMHDGRVAAVDSDVDAALQRMLRYATSPGDSIACPDSVLAPRLSGRRPYHLIGALLRRRLRPFIGMAVPVAVVLITDPERHRPVGTGALKHAYGLTPREAAIAIKLAGGNTLDQAAEQLEMTYETARTHLRRVLAKTETSRQTELVILLERFAATSLAAIR